MAGFGPESKEGVGRLERRAKASTWHKMAMKPRAAIDSNIIVAARKSHTGASHRLVETYFQNLGLWEWKISTAVLLAYEEQLARLRVPHADSEIFLDDLAASAIPVRIPFRLRPFLHHPDDDFIAELAIASGAGVIVTFNTRNFRRGPIAWNRN